MAVQIVVDRKGATDETQIEHGKKSVFDLCFIRG